MYSVISNIIEHVWTSGSSEQSYVYSICGAIIVLCFIFCLDFLSQIFKSFRRKGD